MPETTIYLFMKKSDYENIASKKFTALDAMPTR